MSTSAARSVSVMTAVVAIAGVLTGCVSTQTVAARFQLNSARIRASQKHTRVTSVSRTVKATSVHLVRSKKRDAFVVTVTNSSPQTIVDLPVSVGYVAGGKRVYVNASDDLAYFDAHLPPVNGGKTLTWIFATSKKIPKSAKLFAAVGSKPYPRVPSSQNTVDLEVAQTTAADGAVRLKITNDSGVTQFQLQVYAYAQKAGKYIAAGNATVAQLESGYSRTVKLHLVGEPNAAKVHADVVPTILK